jgi:hypothetical protein
MQKSLDRGCLGDEGEASLSVGDGRCAPTLGDAGSTRSDVCAVLRAFRNCCGCPGLHVGWRRGGYDPRVAAFIEVSGLVEKRTLYAAGWRQSVLAS